MTDFVFSPPPAPSVSVVGGGLFPVRRIFCIGQNYADHVKEMGGDPKTGTPVFFTKPADAIAPNGAHLPFPSATDNLHYEGELVVALGRGGRDIITEEAAIGIIYGFAVGCDLTRRDLQTLAKEKGSPWDIAKGFDNSAPLGAIQSVGDKGMSMLQDARLKTIVNGDIKQDAALSDMIWSVPEIIMALSKLFLLAPGDLIFTGTPSGVGSLQPGDTIDVAITGLESLTFHLDE